MRKLFAVVLWVATATLAFAQLPNSTIDGRVTDPQGLIVAGAHVTLTSTHAQRFARHYYQFGWALYHPILAGRNL